MMTSTDNLVSVCARHPERPSSSTCDECKTPMCPKCALEVPNVGTFCAACGSWRGGLRARRPRRYAPLTAAPRNEEPEPFRTDALRVEPRTLISGLTERLTAAGADPEAVVDEEELFHDVERLRDRPPRDEHHHWWRRRIA